ncbi:MAG: transketolase family protein [Thermodesulfovibrionales bacterium]|nr:transketolase family protein [Thermodesulfovibrionales bacterium]
MGSITQDVEANGERKDFFNISIATRDVYGETLAELGALNKDIVVLDADLSSSTKTKKFSRLFPDRFFNIGISEQDMICTASGLSLTGKIPFASTFAIFATGRAWEQVRQTVCYSNLNVKIVATHGGLTVGEDGASHQSLEDLALMRVLPNMTVIVPADGFETKQVIEEIVNYVGPVYVRLGRAKVPPVMPESYRFKIGKAYIFNVGLDVNIIASGIMVSMALNAAQELRTQGVDVGVVNMSTIKPLDTEALLMVAQKSKFIITAEEHSVIGGLGGAVSEFLSEVYPIKIKKVGVNDSFGLSGKPDELLEFFGLTNKRIVDMILKELS